MLVLAGVYNLTWGAFAIALPEAMMRFLQFRDPDSTSLVLWQGLGFIIAVYGLGYLIASRSPLFHWGIVLVGLIGKIGGPIGVAKGVLDGRLPAEFALASLINDLIWWWPFAVILWAAWKTAPARATMRMGA